METSNPHRLSVTSGQPVLDLGARDASHAAVLRCVLAAKRGGAGLHRGGRRPPCWVQQTSIDVNSQGQGPSMARPRYEARSREVPTLSKSD